MNPEYSRIIQNWRVENFGTAPLEIIDGDRGRNYPKNNEFTTDGYCLFLTANNVTSNGFSFNNNLFISQEKDEKLRQGRVVRGDIILTTRGTLGNVGFYSNSIIYEHLRINSGMVIVRVDKKQFVPEFVYYYLRSPGFNKQVNSLKSGAAQPQLPIRDIKRITIPIPPIDTQHGIASILSAYDDLIENNNRRIALLEESMQLLYREWFVRLRFPGHEHVRVVDGLPEGWERTKLREVASYINRGISPKYGDSENRWVINQKCVREGRLNTYLARQHITEHGIDKGVKFGDVLVNSTGIGTLGRVAQVYEDLENYTVDSHITIVRPNKRVEIDYFGLFILGLQSYFDQMGAGSTGQTELSRDSVANADFILPTIELQKEFGNYISSQRQMIQNLLTQNKKLSEARDLLLPRLMSGEIDVS